MQSKLLNFEIQHLAEDKEWIVFLHGAGGSIATWKYQRAYFAENFNLLLIDLRDHGQSAVEEVSTYDFKLITEDIMAVINQLGIGRAHFVTLSFGSVILQHLSMLHPNYVQSAVFAGGIFKPNLSIRLFVFLAKLVNLFLPYKWMYSIFSYLLMPKRHHQKARKIYQQQAAKLSNKAYLRWVGLYQEFFQLLDKFYHQPLNFPSLVIMGSEDYVFLKSAMKFTQQQVHGDLKMISGAGHICNIDAADSFNQLTYEFMQAHTEEVMISRQNRPK